MNVALIVAPLRRLQDVHPVQHRPAPPVADHGQHWLTRVQIRLDRQRSGIHVERHHVPSRNRDNGPPIALWPGIGMLPHSGMALPAGPHPASTSTDAASASSVGSSIRLRVSSCRPGPPQPAAPGQTREDRETAPPSRNVAMTTPAMSPVDPPGECEVVNHDQVGVVIPAACEVSSVCRPQIASDKMIMYSTRMTSLRSGSSPSRRSPRWPPPIGRSPWRPPRSAACSRSGRGPSG